MRIIFICTANICRSVIAEGILKELVSTHPRAPYIVLQSAGVDAINGLKPDRDTREICLTHGIDIGSHGAQQLTKEMLAQSNFIFCMANNQKQLILSAYPEFIEKTFLLKEFPIVNPAGDVSIEDPIGKSKRHYEECFNEIEKEVNRIARLILTDKLEN